MPYGVKKVDGHQVRNTETGKVHAKGTSKAKAEAQVRLLHGVKHGMKPRTTKQVAGLDQETAIRRGKQPAKTKARKGTRAARR